MWKTRNGFFVVSTELRARPSLYRTRRCWDSERDVGKSKKEEEFSKPKSEPAPNRTSEASIYGASPRPERPRVGHSRSVVGTQILDHLKTGAEVSESTGVIRQPLLGLPAGFSD